MNSDGGFGDVERVDGRHSWCWASDHFMVVSFGQTGSWIKEGRTSFLIIPQRNRSTGRNKFCSVSSSLSERVGGVGGCCSCVLGGGLLLLSS